MTEEELANQIRQYSELKKQNKDIDVASLALAALNSHETNMLSGKDKRWGYLVSLAVPPFGLIYAVKFYTSGKSDGKTAAYVCLGLTAASIILFFVISSTMFSGSGLTVDQVKQAPAQYQDLLQ
jgi:hypothetical protein